jgi:hypothetical protein
MVCQPHIKQAAYCGGTQTQCLLQYYTNTLFKLQSMKKRGYMIHMNKSTSLQFRNL